MHKLTAAGFILSIKKLVFFPTDIKTLPLLLGGGEIKLYKI